MVDVGAFGKYEAFTLGGAKKIKKKTKSISFFSFLQRGDYV